MKLKNIKVGDTVRVRKNQLDTGRTFHECYHGSVGTVDYIYTDEDINVMFTDGTWDYGHHTQLKRVKEKHS